MRFLLVLSALAMCHRDDEPPRAAAAPAPAPAPAADAPLPIAKEDLQKAEAAMTEATKLINEQNLDAAKNKVEEAIEHNMRHAGAHNLLGQIYNQQHKPRLALAQFHEAQRIDPTADYVWEGLGYAWQQLGNWPKAEDAYRRASKAYPSVWSYRGLGVTLQSEGKKPEAIAAFEAALKQPAIPPDVKKELEGSLAALKK